MSKFCIFRIYKKEVFFFQSYNSFVPCFLRYNSLTRIAIMHDINCRFIMRTLDDSENPYLYNPFPKVTFISQYNLERVKK